MRMTALLAVILIVAAPAEAQTANVDATGSVTFTLPTQGQPNNTPLTGTYALTKNQVWIRTAPISDTDASAPTVELGAAVTSAPYTLTIPNGSTIYARIKSCNAQTCSPFSPQGSRQVTIVVPNTPTGVAISVTVTISTTP